jgi:hypothetical protein
MDRYNNIYKISDGTENHLPVGPASLHRREPTRIDDEKPMRM